MKKLASAAFSVLLLSSAALAAGPDFDQGAPSKPAVAAAPAPASVWVTVDPADLSKPAAKGFPLGAPVSATAAKTVYKVPASLLPVLSEFMHDKFKRCAGFFAFRSREAAESAPVRVKAAAAASYTLDQQAVVKPLAAKADEAEIRATMEKLATFNNRYYTADTGVQAAQWIGARWQVLAAKIPGASVRYFKHDGWAQPSVILTVPGAETPDEIVILGGHLDSINGWGSEDARAPGEDDNASGIAVLTEAIRVLGQSGVRPKRTVEFMGYSAEEVGLRGSQDIAQQYAAAGKKVVGVIQYDMSNFPGSGDGIFLLTDNVDPALSAFVNQLIDVYVGVPRSTTECGYACSDHASWTRSGYPSAMAFESSFDDMNHNLHTDHDNLQNAGGDAKHSVGFAKLAVAFALELAKTSAGAFTAAR